MFTLGCHPLCWGKAVLKGPGVTHHITLSFCSPSELPGRERGREEDYAAPIHRAGYPSAQAARRRGQRGLNETSLSRETLQWNICGNVMLISFLQFTAQI